METEYEFLSFLGQGSYGKVFKARHRKSGKECAIKQIQGIFFSNYEAKKILREIHILRKLTSQKQNIFTAKLLDVIIPPSETRAENDDRHDLPFDSIFLVQECFGQDLSQLIRNSDKIFLSEDHILVIIYNILCGLQFMHSAQVVHRDIKPSNILLNSDSNVRICDLGLAKSLSNQSEPKFEERKENDDDNLPTNDNGR